MRHPAQRSVPTPAGVPGGTRSGARAGAGAGADVGVGGIGIGIRLGVGDERWLGALAEWDTLLARAGRV